MMPEDKTVIRKNITDILCSQNNNKFGNQEEVDDNEILRQLNEIDEINVKLNSPFPPHIKLDILGRILPLNCHSYTFDLYTSSKYHEYIRSYYEEHLRYSQDTQKTFPYIACGKFISYLIARNYLQELLNPKRDCLVIYFDNVGAIKHSGILEENNSLEDDRIVRSKWGSFHAIILHKLWHVPCKIEQSIEHDYGTSVKYYHRLDSSQSEEYFFSYLEYAKREKDSQSM